MRHSKYLIFIVLFCFAISTIYAQPAVGEWTGYQSYSSAKNLADTGDKIYCVTEGGLFSFSKTDNSIQKMSGINGLSDVGIQRIDYSRENKMLLIAYQNANIDLLIGNEIFNISDIKRKQLSADKTINNVLFVGNLAYLSCGFGIVVVNLEKKEIKETYIIGKDGAYLNVFDLATDGDYFYAATENGIYRANTSDSNLQNYNNWIKDVSIPHATNKFNKIKFFNGRIIVNYTPDKWSEDELYELKNNEWSRFLEQVSFLSDWTTFGDNLVCSSRENVLVYNDQLKSISIVQEYDFSGIKVKPIEPLGALLDDKNILWIADKKSGLVRIDKQSERILPEGPVNNTIFSLNINGQDLWVSMGGRDRSWNNMFNQPQFQLNREGEWTIFDKKVIPALNDFRDIICVKADPTDPNHVFAGSWGGGILEFRDGAFVKQYNNFNSTLQTALPEKPDAPYVRIGGIDFDSKGNLWVSNSEAEKNISVLKKDGTWESFELSGVANQYSIGKIIVTKNNDKWVMVPRGRGQSISVLNSRNDQSKSQKVIARFVNSVGEFFNEMSDVYAMVEDNKGEIWVGTSGGVAVYSNPESIWTENFLYATRPGLNLRDGFFHPLLEKETITAIAVDGANRKWFGTKSSGVFLISEDGETEIEHFNAENSPLLNNEITDIAINQKSGEVFIGTISGLISYMGEATAGNEAFNDVYVYPNPVRETYQGPIVIKGLMEESDVKITDISGDLVYKTTSLGGQAIWDGKNLNGNRCKTGVYLVFLTDPLGEKTKITKLLFIH
jgi:hypothetical protein